ncbi:hypothetical protein [Paenibacillus sp. QZ-Y1]|uniref:hypothetical protein n=1 Tax=Paenibacillus sp. QZ-Y1 TaxID=3414511 RepID=UPI003F799005
MIRMEQVNYSYQKTPVLNQVTLQESEPIIMCIVGEEWCRQNNPDESARRA